MVFIVFTRCPVLHLGSLHSHTHTRASHSAHAYSGSDAQSDHTSLEIAAQRDTHGLRASANRLDGSTHEGDRERANCAFSTIQPARFHAVHSTGFWVCCCVGVAFPLITVRRAGFISEQNALGENTNLAFKVAVIVSRLLQNCPKCNRFFGTACAQYASFLLECI